MPSRNTRFRAVTEEFRRFLDHRGAWPLVKQFPAALEDKGGGRKADIFRMKAGNVVPEKYVRALVEMLWGRPDLGEFLAMKGIADQDGMSVDQVVECVAEPLQSHPDPGDRADDWHLKGIEGLVGLFTDFVWQTLIRPGTRCEDEDDVRTAVAMIMASCGRDISEDPLLPAGDAIKAAERHMRISQDDYLGRAIDLWRGAPWAFAFAVVDRQRVGCFCVLPLAEFAYEDLRRGARTSHSCSAADLALPSRTFFVEAVGHKADAEYPDIGKKTRQTARTIYLQLAIMSLDGPGPLLQDRRMRILSIAGSPTNARRLKRSGFRPTGTRMPGFGIEYMEMDQRKAWWTPFVVRMLQERLLASGDEF